MRTASRVVFAVWGVASLAGCSQSASTTDNSDSGLSGGGGSSSSGNVSSGTGSSGSSGGTSSASSSSGAGSASSSSGGSSGSSSGGDDASDEASIGGGGGGSGDAGGADDGSAATGNANILGWYEAEAVPPNVVIAPAGARACGMMTPACGPPATIKPEAECCSGMGPHGGEVNQLLRGRGGVTFNQVSAPADGMYDVTWWYHCGLNDNFGDPNCGGEPHTPSGCRPAGLDVNGVMLTRIYQFPCFPGDWGQIHAYTIPTMLKAGATNSITIKAGIMGRDAVDVDAIAVMTLGTGVGPSAGGASDGGH